MLIALIGTLAYAGACVYANFASPTSAIDMPDEEEASYSLVIKNTATVVLTNDYKVLVDDSGASTYYLNGYWELTGDKFTYRSNEIILSEDTFGEIILQRRK